MFTRGAFAGAGGRIIGGTDFLAVLVAVLGFQPAVLGFLAMIPGLAQLVQLFSAPRVEVVRRKKRLLVYLDLCRWPLPLAVCASLVLFGHDSPMAVIVAIVISLEQVCGGRARLVTSDYTLRPHLTWLYQLVDLI